MLGHGVAYIGHAAVRSLVPGEPLFEYLVEHSRVISLWVLTLGNPFEGSSRGSSCFDERKLRIPTERLADHALVYTAHDKPCLCPGRSNTHAKAPQGRVIEVIALFFRASFTHGQVSERSGYELGHRVVGYKWVTKMMHFSAIGCKHR